MDNAWTSGGRKNWISFVVSRDGNMLAVGASTSADGPGFAAVLRFEDGSWVQVGQELAGDEDEDDFCASVSLSSNGSVFAVGAEQRGNFGPGYARVFRLQGNSWVRVGQEREIFGFHVALSDDGVVLAAGDESVTRVIV